MNKAETTKAGPESAPAVAQYAAASAPNQAAAAPDIKVKKGKKRKYSRGLKEVQQSGRALTKSGRRIARAIASGFSEFYRRDKESSQKRRDGSIRDVVKNWSKGVSKALRRGSNAPRDLADVLDTKTIRRAVRNTARLLAPPFAR